MMIFLKKIIPFLLVLAFLFPVAPSINTGANIDISTNTASAQTSQGNQEFENPGFTCWSWSGDFNFGACIADIIYYLVYSPSIWILSVTASLFDAVAAFTLSSNVFDSATIVIDGWELLRDFANIFFIFALLYVSFSLILGIGQQQAKSMLVAIIIMAFLINFSMVLTRVVIDASNITALLFYNRMGVEQTIQSERITQTDVEEKEIAAGIAQGMRIQNMIGEDTISSMEEEAAGSAVTFIFIYLLASAVNLVAVYVFLVIALLFIARIIGLWLVMIFAPLAFISYALPKTHGLPYVGWNDWLGNLFKFAFMAPVFFFFLYLIIILINSGFITDQVSENLSQMSLFQVLTIILLQFAIISALLLQSVNITKQMSGEIGTKVIDASKKIGGAALGLAGGAAALGTRAAAGAALRSAPVRQETKDAAAKGSIKAKARVGLDSWMKNSSFDPRKSWAGKGIEKAGLDTSTKGSRVPGVIDLKTEGGIKGREERRKQDSLEQAEKLKMTDREKQEQDQKAKRWEQKYQEEKEKAKSNQGSKFNEEEFRKEYEKGTAKQIDDNGNSYNVGAPKVKDGQTVEKERMQAFADDLEFGQGYTEKKEKAKKEAESSGEKFNEEQWREKENIKRTNSDGRLQAAKEIREKFKPEFSEKQLEKERKLLQKQQTELGNIEETLKEIAENQGLLSKDDKDNPEKVKEAIENIDKKAINEEIEKIKDQGSVKVAEKHGVKQAGLRDIELDLEAEKEKHKQDPTPETRNNITLLEKQRNDLNTRIKEVENAPQEKDRLEKSVEEKNKAINK